MTKAAITPWSLNFGDCLPPSNSNFYIQLATNTHLEITAPGDSTQLLRVKFSSSYNADIWVSYGTNATSPSAGTATASTTQEYLPKYNESRFVKGGTTLSFIATTGTPQVGVSFYLVQDN